MLTYGLAVLAACANATSSVLQRKANRAAPQKDNLSWRLIRDLVAEPVWFGGILAIIVGFLLQATALGTGQLATVEPILVLELPATLILAARVFGSRMRRREWTAAAAMTAGLAALLYSLSPSPGHSAGPHWYVWLAGVTANAAFAAVLVVLARRDRDRRSGRRPRGSPRQAALLGVAAGSVFGLTAALMKGMTQTFAQGFTGLFTSWELYGMVAAGLAGMFLLQSAMNAGQLLATQPGLTLSDPIVSIIWGVLAFGEQVRGSWYILADVVSLAVMAAAVLALARSPLLDDRRSAAAASPRPGR